MVTVAGSATSSSSSATSSSCSTNSISSSSKAPDTGDSPEAVQAALQALKARPNNSKMEALLAYIRGVRERHPEEKIVVFTQWCVRHVLRGVFRP